MREPWRNTWAHLYRAIGWDTLQSKYANLELVRDLTARPLATLQTMVEKGLNSPPASSCGRLFDAVAAALGVCRDEVSHEGQAAMELESMATCEFHHQAQNAYPFESRMEKTLTLGWRPLWQALLDDLQHGVDRSVIAARFHQGLVCAVTETAHSLCQQNNLDTVVLGGGVFQNRLMLEGISERMRAEGLQVLSPVKVPANDGGLALGQVAIATARLIAGAV